jgi:hypothetical protein
MGSVGGTGGTPFGPFFCPTGSVATSLRGHAGDDIDRTEIWCTPLAGGTEVQAGAVGGFGGQNYGETLACPTGSTITGLHGRAGTVLWGGFVVDTLGVTCRNPKTGAAVNLGPVGNAAPNANPFTLSCEAGKSVVAIYGGQGGLLDRIGIYCQ